MTTMLRVGSLYGKTSNGAHLQILGLKRSSMYVFLGVAPQRWTSWAHTYTSWAPDTLYKIYVHQQMSCGPLRGEPTESIDGYYHRNKTITFWSNGITCLYRKYMVYPLKDIFTIESGLLFV